MFSAAQPAKRSSISRAAQPARNQASSAGQVRENARSARAITVRAYPWLPGSLTARFWYHESAFRPAGQAGFGNSRIANLDHDHRSF